MAAAWSLKTTARPLVVQRDRRRPNSNPRTDDGRRLGCWNSKLGASAGNLPTARTSGAAWRFWVGNVAIGRTSGEWRRFLPGYACESLRPWVRRCS